MSSSPPDTNVGAVKAAQKALDEEQNYSWSILLPS